MTPTERDRQDWQMYEDARKALCEEVRHHLPSLDLIAEMDTYVSLLRDRWLDLDPDGVL